MMTRLTRILGGAVLFAVSSGCGILPARPPEGVRHFVLSTLPCSKEEFSVSPVSRAWIEASSSLQTSEIMYQRTRLERGFYQYASWIEPIPDRLRSIIEDALACHGIYRPQRNGRILRIHVREFYHSALEEPGEAIIKMDVTLTDGPGGTVLSLTQVASSVPVTDFSSLGAVTALDRATHEAVEKILAWLKTVP